MPRKGLKRHTMTTTKSKTLKNAVRRKIISWTSKRPWTKTSSRTLWHLWTVTGILTCAPRLLPHFFSTMQKHTTCRDTRILSQLRQIMLIYPYSLSIINCFHLRIKVKNRKKARKTKKMKNKTRWKGMQTARKIRMDLEVMILKGVIIVIGIWNVVSQVNMYRIIDNLR